ncbi:glycosyltransferase family 2 protein [Corynebacterium aquilae]|uniref:Glycosyl transferase n=1 Tax=Corynebacterium aquilae DSM 44791 TaxID=1431546 RepID=A0A1L7CDI3_9CORY|nr:glycosyltransferase family 2 protein [Corynebacterium aquilae]APT83889.1 glycosyl transferase [Corynebacterium aquilae DSM 44791]
MKLGIVIVSYGHEAEVARLVDSFTPQLREGDRVIVVDNKKPWQMQEAGVAEIIQHDNGGFAAGCNVGAAAAGDVDVLFFLNPDTYVEDPNLLDVIRSGYDTPLAAWMPYLVLPDGTVNSAGNALHISGLSWVNGYGQRPDIRDGFTDISIASGACLAVRRQWWERLGGMAELYFMYHEDTDFSARLLLAGGQIGLLHGAQVHHDYDYSKGDYKWIYIERNRLLFILATWPWPVIAVLAPQLVAVGLGLWAIAAKQGRLGLKLKSTKLFFQAIPEAIRFRRTVEQSISAAEFLAKMDCSVDNPFLGPVADSKLVAAGYRAYYKAASWAIRRK